MIERFFELIMAISTVAVFLLVLMSPAWVPFAVYHSQYRTNDDNKTATKGFIFKDTIILDKYQIVGEGENIMCLGTGHYKITRSINHEVITVCKLEKNND